LTKEAWEALAAELEKISATIFAVETLDEEVTREGLKKPLYQARCLIGEAVHIAYIKAGWHSS